jgi:predicted PurR-regulated permease PerM
MADFFRERTPRYTVALVSFLGLILLFRHLLVLLAFFVAFERALFFTAGLLSRRFKWARTASFGATLGVFAVGLGLAIWLSAGRLVKLIVDARERLPERVAQIKESELFQELKPHLPDTDKIVESLQHYATDVVHSAATLGHLVLMALIGLILAIVYFFEEDEVQRFFGGLDPLSFSGTLSRWFGHLADAVSLTVQLQMIVALCNTLFTLPVLLLIGVPHIPVLMLLIFLSSLIPVVGNLISGAVLIGMAYQAKGIVGVIIFAVLTFLLHKVEAYYLNPRLTARHVHLPGLVLIMSLIAWEHLLGFVGLFVSFPFLYVAGRLRLEILGLEPPETGVKPTTSPSTPVMAMPVTPAPPPRAEPSAPTVPLEPKTS